MIYLMHKDGSCGGKLMAEKSCGDYCYTGTDLWSHIPIKFKVLAVVISKGSTFSPPAGWSSPMTVAKPTFDPPPGNYAERQYVTISSGTTGAEVYYELYGSEPTVDSRLYTQKVSVPINRTIKAVAYKHCTYSEVVTVNYTIGGTGIDEPVVPIRATVTAGQAGQGARISVDAEDVGNYLVAEAYTSRGDYIATLEEESRSDKEVILYWNGKDSRGQAVAPGVYMVKLRSNSAAGVVKAVMVR
jgi:hypothetical protein